jgi:hypothetical protein
MAMDIPPCGELFRKSLKCGMHLNRPPVGLGTTREAAKRQSFRLEMSHHHMPAHATQGLASEADRQPQERDRAGDSRVAAM